MSSYDDAARKVDELAQWQRERLHAETGPAEAADLAAALDEVGRWLLMYVAYPSEHAAVAHVLWIAHTHAMDSWHSTPRIAFLSPEPGSGKTRALEVTEPLVPNPILAVNVTPAYMFRKIGQANDEGSFVTILHDEIDTVFGPRVREVNEDVRALINAGHRNGAVAGRCASRGSRVVTEEIPAYSAVALAGLGDLPDTIRTRSVVVRMKRRAPGEAITPYRERYDAPTGRKIGEDLAASMEAVERDLAAARPSMPAGIEDRDADVWEPLIAIADAAGGEWPTRAREAAEAIVAEAQRDDTASLGIRLLRDLKVVFGPADRMFTADILARLKDLEEAPWGDLRGKPLDPRGLAWRLRQYGVRPREIRIGEQTKRGYRREDLHDAWQRYLGADPAPVSQESETSETSETSQSPLGDSAFRSEDGSETSETGVSDVSDTAGERNAEEPTNDSNVSDVSDVSLGGREEGEL